ncbi:MAG: hypothetical protein A2W18_05045 [Candidatus Muproteobacteria bacterium RBG_16_60_9]|uniref:DUF2905 domain-containing protein n=1 Tax=Candidatus Muproteobacteria bacterium RBG_16_60_9 TaxID=1817755 RepID=A0A1F6UVD8_9PROT|nr:MAG: hypothetical protein A2W18_05045 [Candidatus Muproteobacteria bacterium RBG_16_60_9]
MSRTLIVIGAILIVLGLLWPWITKMGLFRLPGDIVFQRDGFRFYLPITTMIVISVVISLVLWLFRK